jgi:hypothetical protein
VIATNSYQSFCAFVQISGSAFNLGNRFFDVKRIGSYVTSIRYLL